MRKCKFPSLSPGIDKEQDFDLYIFDGENTSPALLIAWQTSETTEREHKQFPQLQVISAPQISAHFTTVEAETASWLQPAILIDCGPVWLFGHAMQWTIFN